MPESLGFGDTSGHTNQKCSPHLRCRSYSPHMATTADEGMLPDFGTWLLETAGPEADFTFVCVAVTQLNRVEQDLFMLNLELPHMGQQFMVSIEFGRKQLLELAAAMPDELSQQLIPHFSTPFRAPAELNLPIPIEVSIDARLGSVQTNDQESYVPLVAKKIRVAA